MPKREIKPLSEAEFEAAKIKLFATAKDELKVFGKKLADYCWNLDRFAGWQHWEGRKESLLVFGVSPENRSRSNAKNYFGVWKVISHSDETLKCEPVPPINDALRRQFLKDHDPRSMLRKTSIGGTEGDFRPSDYEYLIGLINAAQEQKIATPRTGND